MKLKRLTQLAEIAASIAVVFTLVILVLEIRTNTAVVQQQAQLNRIDSVFLPFLDPESVKSAYIKIKARDGNPEDVELFMDRYQMSENEAISWVMLLNRQWNGYLSSFHTHGPNQALAETIESLIKYPDQQLFLDTFNGSEEFLGYIDSLKGKL